MISVVPAVARILAALPTASFLDATKPAVALAVGAWDLPMVEPESGPHRLAAFRDVARSVVFPIVVRTPVSLLLGPALASHRLAVFRNFARSAVAGLAVVQMQDSPLAELVLVPPRM